MKKIYFLALLLTPFLLVAQTLKQPATMVWQKTFGGSQTDRATSVIPTSDNGFLVVGLSFSNDGVVTGHHGTTDSSDAWVVKLNSAGDMEWQKSYGGTNTDAFTHAVQAGDGDFICVGSTRSVDGDVTGLHTGTKVASDVWVVRIDRYGAIKWSKAFGGSDEDHGTVIRKMVDGNYIVAGDAASNDYDVSGNHGGVDIWALKINGQGNLIWQQPYGDGDHQYTSSLTVTSDNKYVISGYVKRSGAKDDPNNHLPYYNAYEEAAVKFDGNGNMVWQNYVAYTPGNPGPSKFYSRIVELPSHQLYGVGNSYNASSTNIPTWLFKRLDNTTGSYLDGQASSNQMSASPSITQYGPDAVQVLSDSSVLSCISMLPCCGPNEGTITRINTQKFSPFYYKNTYGTGTFYGVVALTDDDYVVAGSNGSGDFWIVKMNSINQIKGKAFLDNNSNGIKDAGEPYFTHGFVESKKGGLSSKSYISTAGDFLNFVDTGTYTSTVTVSGRAYYTVTPSSKQSAFTTYKNKDSFPFAVAPMPGKNDLQVSLFTLSFTRPGATMDYTINYKNVGTTTIGNTVIKLAKPAAASFVSATVTPSSIAADTITWNIGSTAPFDEGEIHLLLQLGIPPAVNMGDVIACSAVINPVAGDVMPADNTAQTRTTVMSSYDPNDKTDNVNGTFYIDQVQANESLTYTVRFQNTGTDTAFTIVVKDTLSSQLDESTLEMVSASHPYTFSIKDNKYCTWTFNNVLLVDSNRNEPASHGYITYRIKPRSTLQVGDIINNSASIYFDFNQPVKTNTMVTTIKVTPPPAPPQPVISGLQPNYCTSAGAQKAKLLNLQAATGNTTVTAKLDATTLTVAADSTVTFAIATLTAGTHNLTVTYSNVTDTKTTTASFTIMVAANPDVNVTANITTVTNLANPVMVTAVNASGGGKSPLYTFAWNNSFTNILQSESSNSGVTITPAGLALGDNKVYVRMKTSESCFTAQTNTDSITIRRDQATGIVDIDNPGQVINVYPNPVNGPITVNGLSSGKSYTLTIVNLQGQVVFTKRVINQNSTNISDLKVLAGTYLLTIFDEKKNRILGAVQLIKK